MKNYLIIDLECTCDEDKNNFNRNKMEIIEIGAVLVDENFNLIDEFSTFVKPTINPTLTSFCTKLTTITQKDVDDAPYIEEALDSLRSFARQNGFYTFVSWGGFDYRQIKRETALKGIDNVLKSKNINYKDNYKEITGVRATSITRALRDLKTDFKGTQHRAVYDAKNIYRIVKRIGI